MNILFLSTRLTYPPIGGHFQRTFNVVKYLAQKNNIFYVSFYKKDLKSIDNMNYLKEMKKYCKECYAFEIPLERSKMLLLLNIFKSVFFKKPFIAYKYYCKEAQDCIKDILLRNEIDFVHFDMLPLVEYWKLLLKIEKNLLTEHNVEYMRYLRWFPFEKNIFKKFYIREQYKKLKKYEIKAIEKFKLCVVMSEFDKKILSKDAKNVNFEIVPNGTNVDYFKPKHTVLRPNTLVWVGGMTMWPNRDAVVYFVKEIFPLILEKNPKVIFKVIGKNPHPILKYSKNSEQIEIHGYVEDIRATVMDSMVYVAPIRIGSGTKLKILDAMAMGKTVITTPVGAEGIEVENQKHLFICNTPEEFAETTIKLLSDIELNKEIGQNARRLIEEKYSWNKVLKKLDKLYE